jgi:transposase
VREVVNGIMYVLSTGCQWRYVPKDLPPKSTLYDYFDLWTYDGTLENIHHALYVRCRAQIGREASPTAAIIDSQSVKSAETLRPAQEGACIDPHGYDAGKKINGKTRHILVDTLGLLLDALVHPPDSTFAWLNRCRRLAKDFENLTRNALAFLRLASIRLMLRKLCLT